MDIGEVEENNFAVTNAKLHGGMYKILSSIYCKVLQIFPGLEALRPRSKSGIQSLCSLHVALEKTKNILQHCSECSKLYLAITGESVLMKFEKARSALADSLRQVEDIVPQYMSCQIQEIVNEIEGTQFSLDTSEKQVGDGLIALLQRKRKFNSNSNDTHELETFHQDVCRLGITSSRAALTERRALKKLIERARKEDDKHKEAIVAFLFQLMKKYSKYFRSEVSDDNDSQGSTPCSPTIDEDYEDANGSGRNGHGHAFERHLSKLNSFNFAPNNQRSEHMPFPPEELRCPISLQLMHDPVIISSGQTYERLCIEQWFCDGHNTCPKTQHQLPNFDLTPNYSVKGLISSWCGQNGVPIPDAPPDCLDLNYWRLALSEGESNSKSVNSIGACKFKGVTEVSLEEGGIIEESEGIESLCTQEEEAELNLFERYGDFLNILNSEVEIRTKCKVVEQIRHLLKDDAEARIFMGANGFVEALMQFLITALDTSNKKAQEVGAMALFNLAVNNNRNQEMMLAAGMISVLEEMIANSNSHASATALYLNLSCLDEAKAIICSSSNAVPFLIHRLGTDNSQRCRRDSLQTLYNLSTLASGVQNLLSAGIVNSLSSLLTLVNDDRVWTERSIAVLSNIAATKQGKDEMMSNPDLISRLATILDEGGSVEQEQTVSCLLTLCTGNDNCSQMVLQEGVIPSLVSISVNGTMRGKEKAQKLLMLFREQRQRDSPTLVAMDQQHSDESCDEVIVPVSEQKETLRKVVSKRKVVGKALSFLWKSKASQLSGGSRISARGGKIC